MSNSDPATDEIVVYHELPFDGLDVALRTAVGEALPLPTRSLAARLRAALAEAGGVAGSLHLAAAVGLASGREVRAVLRGSRVQNLGAGYLALPATVEVPVDRWLTAWILRSGPISVETAISLVLAQYPHGDAAAVRAWLHQEPGRLRVDGSEIWVFGARRPQPG